ncbi:MAG: hypothetical protein U0Q22_11240 [Acidimicrobiales bacterium]
MFLEIPDGAHPIMHVWGDLVPGIGPAASRFSQAVYERSTLELDAFEAARLRMAQINGCLFCKDWRTERDGITVDDDFPQRVEHWADEPGEALSPRARLAAEFSERFALDHHGIDDAFWERLRAEFTDAELVELTMCLGSWLAFGRLNHIFGLDAACQLPGHSSAR